MAGFLNGIRCVEFAARGVGPIAGLVLTSLGAEIVKIESPKGGDPTRGYDTLGANKISPGGHTITFEFTNRNKKSVTIDLSTPKGREIAYKLISKSDVFFSNYVPASLKKVGFDYESLSKLNPKLIYASSSSFGKSGPDKDKRALDGLGLARSGLMLVSGEPGDPPTEIRGTIADCTAGTYLAWGIVGALLARERMGIGQEVDTSLFGPLIWMQQWNVAQSLLGQQGMGRQKRSTSLPPIGNAYKCKDGKWIKVSTSPGGGKDLWHEFCEVFNLQYLEKDPRFENPVKRVENAEAFVNILDAMFLNKTRDEWIAYIDSHKAGFLYERILDISELANDAQALANNYIIEEDHPNLGHIKSVQFPVHFSKTSLVSHMKPAPSLGEHTDEVLSSIGYSKAELAKLRSEKII